MVTRLVVVMTLQSKQMLNYNAIHLKHLKKDWGYLKEGSEGNYIAQSWIFCEILLMST